MTTHAARYEGRTLVALAKRRWVDLINGLVVDETVRRGREAPAIAVIVEITRRIRSGELKPEPSNLILARSMLDCG